MLVYFPDLHMLRSTIVASRTRVLLESTLLLRSLGDVIRPNRAAFAVLACCQLLQGITPAGFVLLTAAVATGRVSAMAVLLPMVALLLMMADALETYSLMLVTQVREKSVITIRGRMLRSTALWPDLGVFEDRELVRLRLQAQQAVDRSGRVVLVITNLMGGVLGLAPLVVLASRVSPWLPWLILLGLVPVTLSSIRLEERAWSAEKDHLEEIALADNLAAVGGESSYAKDVRTFQMGGWLVRRWTDERFAVFRAIRSIRARGALRVTVLSLVSVSFSAAGLWLAAGGVWDAGAVIITLGVLLQMRSQMYAVVGNLAQLGEIWSPLVALARFTSLVPTQPDGATARPKTGGMSPAGRNDLARRGIELRGVTFSYPGSSGPAVKSVDLTVPRESTLAVVGPNGAGKSTLVKLMAGLYCPDSGEVVSNGSPAIMHQDYSRFPLSLRDNVAAGATIPDEELVAMLEVVGLGGWLQALPRGLDTRLYKIGAEDGTLVSGGQWQRIALARTALRARAGDVVILDEPSSALDPEAENSVITALLDRLDHCAVVWVTHRMNQAAQCDAIAVIQDGMVADVGPPVEIHRRNVWFRTGYEAQRRGFVEL